MSSKGLQLGARCKVAEENEPAAETLETLGPPPRQHRLMWLVRLLSITLVCGSWEYFGRQINPLFMSYPSAIFRAAIAMAESGQLWEALQSSLVTLLSGFVIASVLGVILGLLIGRYRYIDTATDWLVNGLYATPLVAIMPLVILWFG